MKTQYLTTVGEVQDFVDHALAQPWLALDTEFVRERTYAPQLCLLQLATAERLVLVDVLAVDVVEVLRPLLEAGPVKLVHSPGQDFEALATVGLRLLCPLFDTQSAHALLGGPPQVGYAGLVKERLGLDLPKDQTRTDWSQRPLSAAQQDYAADDVRYLGTLYTQLSAALSEAGRAEWQAEDMRALEQAFALPDPWEQALRSRALERLEPVERPVYVALSVWREQRAQSTDKPRSWIAKDGLLAAIARRRPNSLDALGRIDGCTPGLLRSQGKQLLQVIETAAERCPPVPEPIPKERLKPLQKAVAERASGLGIDPSLLGSRSDLEQWLRQRSGRLAQGWRQGVCAEFLEAEG